MLPSAKMEFLFLGNGKASIEEKVTGLVVRTLSPSSDPVIRSWITELTVLSFIFHTKKYVVGDVCAISFLG